MPDDKEGREKQAADEERRQRERELQEELERTDEAEPPAEQEGEDPEDLETVLADHDYPATTAELVETFGGFEVETQDGLTTFAAALDGAEGETFDSPEDVRDRVRELVGR